MCCAVGACGADDDKAAKGPGADTATVTAQTAEPSTSDRVARPPSPRDATAPEREAAEVALRYARAVADRDWPVACTTRSRAGRADLARTAGSCERALSVVFKGKPVELFETVLVGDVRIRGRRAGVDLVQPGQKKPFLTLGAVRQRTGRWLLEELPNRQIP